MPPRHVVLVGTMGSGKSTVGRLVAVALGWPFWDNDEQLVRERGKSAAEIAQRHGPDELHRREIETLIRGLDRDGPSVVAAAASVVVDPQVRARLRAEDLVVWLRASHAALEERLLHPGDRPTLGESPTRRAGELQDQRADLYRDIAQREVDTTNRRPEAVAQLILSALAARRMGRRGPRRD
jgi:shikimate kinase